MNLKPNLSFLPNQILLAPALDSQGRPATTEVVLLHYLTSPEIATLDNGEEIALDCTIYYPGLDQYANACSGCLSPAR